MSRASTRTVALSILLLASGVGAPPTVLAQDLALIHANVVDVTTGDVTPDAALVIVDGTIERIEASSTDVPEGMRVYDVQGMYVSPGLMDAHVHVSSLDAARRALRSGVTTARSMGVSHYADVGLRALAAAGHVEAPEVLAAGYHVRPRMAEAFFLDHPEHGDLVEGGVKGPEAIGRVVSEILEHDVDFIKTTSTERAGLPETDPRKQLYSRAEVGVMVEAARARGIGVAAHAHGDDGARAAVLAGVRSIEHGTFMTEETLRLMAERGTFLVPTVAIVSDLTIPGGDYDSPTLQIRGRYMQDRLREIVATAHRLGVPVVASTDTGYGPGSTVRIGHELEELVGIGLSPLEALRSATAVAAELFGISERTGRLAVGLEGDLVVTERNPLEDIRALQDPLLVVSDGRVAATRGDQFEEQEGRPVSRGGS